MGNYISVTSSTKTPTTTLKTQSNLDTNHTNTIMQSSNIDKMPSCYSCSTTKGRDNTSLYPFHVKGEEEKQLLCLDCYMKFNRENKLFVSQETNKKEACEGCKKVDVELYTRGMVQARLCGECIDG